MRADEFIQDSLETEASYGGNIGISELFKFYASADPTLINKVKQLISLGRDKDAWQIVQGFTGAKLVGKEFEPG
jgi:hypothetical protein